MITNEKDNDMNPLVSIVVPIYGAEQYIEQCIESLINQSYHNIEIILVDDASKDKCPQICDLYADKDLRIHVIHKKNGGAAAARKSGAEISTGEYITFVDADDWIEQDMILKMLQRLIDFEADVVICNFFRDKGLRVSREKIFFQEGDYNKQLLKEKIYPQMVYAGSFGGFGIMPSLWGKIFKTSILKSAIKNAPSEVSLGDDATVLYPLMLQAEKCYIMNDFLYHYRVNESSMTLSFNKKQTLDTINVICFLRKSFVGYENYHLQAQLDVYQLFITMRNIVNIGMAGFSKGYRNRIREFKKYLNRTSFYDILQHKSIKEVDVNKNIKLGMLLLKIHFSELLVFIYCLKNVMKKQK